MGKILNFDQFMSEMKRETMEVKIYGKTYHVPMEVPAIVPVAMARAELATDADSTGDDKKNSSFVFAAADAMLGKDNVDEICRKGMTASQLATLVGELFVAISGKVDDDGDAQELSDEDSRVASKDNKRKK